MDYKTNLSAHFTLGELVDSPTARKRGIDNTPTEEVVERLRAVVLEVLEPARIALGMPIRVTSGYRSPALNSAVGGAKSSQHMLGEAVDISCDDNKRLYEWLRDHTTYDQLIWEKGNDRAPLWIHVSYTTRRPNRKQIRRIR